VNRTQLHRLERLEAAQPVPEKPPSPWPMVFRKLIALHLGGWAADTVSSPAKHYALATGLVPLVVDRIAAHQRDLHRYPVAVLRRRPSHAVAIKIDTSLGEHPAQGVPEVLGVLIAEAEAGGMTFPELSADAA
jgi:hypothetical protein